MGILVVETAATLAEVQVQVEEEGKRVIILLDTQMYELLVSD